MATNLHACDNSPYEGYEAAGMARDVILNGELVVETGKLIAAGRGEYVRRDRCGRYRK